VKEEAVYPPRFEARLDLSVPVAPVAGLLNISPLSAASLASFSASYFL